MNDKKICQSCGQELRAGARFCTKCGRKILPGSAEGPAGESLNLRILYIMVSLLILAVLFPPWEAPPSDPPEYLGFHFILSPPIPGAVISRMLQSIELVTIAVAGMSGAWLFRERPPR
ncbi:MAG: zinc ribbon domain-containing protein [Nitrospinae bacterium]|nr:zinc ribbon domain-containing protein [Nitrospinota bacterium]